MLFQINFVKFLNEIKSRYFQYYFLFFCWKSLTFSIIYFYFCFHYRYFSSTVVMLFFHFKYWWWLGTIIIINIIKNNYITKFQCCNMFCSSFLILKKKETIQIATLKLLLLNFEAKNMGHYFLKKFTKDYFLK